MREIEIKRNVAIMKSFVSSFIIVKTLHVNCLLLPKLDTVGENNIRKTYITVSKFQKSNSMYAYRFIYIHIYIRIIYVRT